MSVAEHNFRCAMVLGDLACRAHTARGRELAHIQLVVAQIKRVKTWCG